MDGQWVSITAYAETHAVSRDTVYKWLSQGLLDTFRVQRCIRVLNVPPSDKTRREARPVSQPHAASA